MGAPPGWDIFCRVVDNYGDAGVCWRLARELASEQHTSVRLWVDRLPILRRLVPALADAPDQRVGSVEVRAWSEEFPAPDPARITLEAFGCGLPEEHVLKMADRRPAALWLVLEHLSAEPWVREFHGLPSPHPRWPVARYFFFPGFTAGTGGLLRERDLLARRDSFNGECRDAFWRAAGHAPTPPDATVVSLFAYDSARVADLFDAWSSGNQLTVAALPEGALTAAAVRYFGSDSCEHRVLQHGALELRVLPFLPQPSYDELLWSCDVNFVRGEDSFVRAQWAARPFVWHIYPQAGEAHRTKLEAFLELYATGLPRTAADAILDLTRLWNGIAVPATTFADAWRGVLAHQARLREHALAWAGRIAHVGRLTENLASFCREKLE